MTYQTLNPATEEILQTYPELSWEESEAKALQARQAFVSWRKTSFAERKSLVHRLAELLRDNKNSFAKLMTTEMGKPVVHAEIELDKCVRGCEYYAENAEKFLSPIIVPMDTGRSYVRYDPLGTVLGIMPWNFPFWQVLRFSIPALMAGNTVLLKHAPNVPGCALAIEELFHKAGFPKGVFQSLFLSNENAAKLIDQRFVQGVSLTGSDRAKEHPPTRPFPNPHLQKR